jgi:RNA polymerase sigma-70 factor (ECF subfamily)
MSKADDSDLQRRLSSITTMWTQVLQAHQGEGDSGGARGRLLNRYILAAYRYLLGAVRDTDAANDLFQEFALRFVRGDFKRADPQRGRFRDFVKTALYHLVASYRQGQRRAYPLPLSEAVVESAAAEPTPEADAEFTARWREELLQQTWNALRAFEQQDANKPYYTVLRYRAEHPGLSSTEMAGQLATHKGRTLSSDALRQVLHRAREKFAELLIAEVSRSLESEDEDRVEQELLDLGLFSYCKAAWKRRGG